MFQGQGEAQAEASPQAKTDHRHPDAHGPVRRQQQAKEARQLDRQRQPQPWPTIRPAAQQQRQAQRTGHLENGHQPHQVTTALGRAAMLQMVGRQPGDHAGVAAVDQAEVQRQQPCPTRAEPVATGSAGQFWRSITRAQHGPGQHRQQCRHCPYPKARLPVTKVPADVRPQHCGQPAATHQCSRIQAHGRGQAAGEPAIDQAGHHALHHRHAKARQHCTGEQCPGAVQLQAPQAGQGDGGEAAEHAAMLADPAPQPGLQQRHQAHAQHR
ncbi:hypothetical protein D3C76_1000900 [compost metagenome]